VEKIAKRHHWKARRIINLEEREWVSRTSGLRQEAGAAMPASEGV
jgi:hypothetical protein